MIWPAKGSPLKRSRICDGSTQERSGKTHLHAFTAPARDAPGDIERKKQMILRTIRHRLIVAGALGLGGVLSFVMVVILVYRQLLPPTEQR